MGVAGNEEVDSRDERVQHYLYLYLYLYNHMNYLYLYLYSDWAGPKPGSGSGSLEMGGALTGMLF